MEMSNIGGRFAFEQSYFALNSVKGIRETRKTEILEGLARIQLLLVIFVSEKHSIRLRDVFDFIPSSFSPL